MFKQISGACAPTIFFAAVVSSSFNVAAHAQGPSPTSCLPVGDQTSAEDISEFVANPSKTMAANPDGGLGLSTQVQRLAASSSSTFQPIMDTLATANEAQRSAAAAGLARAVDACRKTGTSEAAAYADSIQAAVVATNDATIITAYQVALRDLGQAVASIGGAAAGPGAAGGGATGSGNSQTGAVNNYRPGANIPSQVSSLRTYSVNYVNSYGDFSTATSNSGTGQ